jgi:NADPH-dependent curcumin reductase CurA
MNAVNRQWVLAARPDGIPDDDTFRLDAAELPPLPDEHVRIRVHYFTLDPGSRPSLTRDSYVPAHPIGAVMMSAGVGEVIESNHDKFVRGDLVAGALGWQAVATLPAKGLVKLDARLFPDTLPLTAALGVLGIPGLTAYFAVTKLGGVKAGETVLVSSAAGTVGAIAGAIAQVLGANAVGTAGSDEKIEWLLKDAGFSGAINYKSCGDLADAIAHACAGGVDVYIDNVGGATLDAAILNMNRNGRLVISGQVSEYNRAEPVGIRNTMEFISKRLIMQGFVVLDYAREFAEAQAKLAEWLLAGKINIREEIIDGIENAPVAYRGLFTGDAFGRRLIRVV